MDFIQNTSVVYGCMKTKYTDNYVRNKYGSFDTWLATTVAYQKIYHYCKSCFFPFDMEKEYSRNGIDKKATVFIDVLTGHDTAKNRHKLNTIINSVGMKCIHVVDINELGDNVDEILEVYERCKEKRIAIMTVDYSFPNAIRPYSTCLFDFEFNYDLYDNALEVMRSLSLIDKRGTKVEAITTNFIDSYFLYEAQLIDEQNAIKLSNFSPNTFHTRSIAMEQAPKNFVMEYRLPFASDSHGIFETIQEKWLDYFHSLGLIDSDEYINHQPKRYGPIPETAKELEESNYIDAENKYRKKAHLPLLQPDSGIRYETFRKLCQMFHSDWENSNLYEKCVQLGLPLMTTIDFNRYRLKLNEYVDKGKRYRPPYNTEIQTAVQHYLYTSQEQSFMEWFLKGNK